MAQLFFRYGAMNSGKSFEILKVAFNYEEQGKAVKVLTSGIDDRSGVGKLKSRVGLERDATPIFDETDIFELVKDLPDKVYCVLVDEAQFLNKEHVVQCARVVDELNIPVMAFGLKTNFKNQLFEGSEALLSLADKIEEMKTICWFCNHKALMNLRVNDGKPIYDGPEILIGGNESYYPVCRKHYYNPPIGDNNG